MNMGVMTARGGIVLTVIPYWPSSSASVLVSTTTPPFDAE